MDVVWVGPGRAGLDRIAGALSSDHYDRVLFTGLAGALAPDLSPGTLLAADEVVTLEGERIPVLLPPALGLFAEESPAVAPLRTGRILSSDRLVATPSEKLRLYEQTGAMAVDMESAGWLSVTRRAGIPASLIRAVSDGAEEPLPPELLSFVTEEGDLALSSTLRALLFRPALLVALISLGPSLRRGRQGLSRLGGAIFDSLGREGR